MKNQCLLIVDLKFKFSAASTAPPAEPSQARSRARQVASFASKQIFAQGLLSSGSDKFCILTPCCASRGYDLEGFLAEEAFMQC